MTSGPANILSIYAPTPSADEDTKDHFYEELHYKISNTLLTESLFLLENFNTRVGDDQYSWPR